MYGRDPAAHCKNESGIEARKKWAMGKEIARWLSEKDLLVFRNFFLIDDWYNALLVLHNEQVHRTKCLPN